jgi:hypothetical protein
LFLSVQKIFSEISEINATLNKPIFDPLKIIGITILDFNLSATGSDFHQVIGINSIKNPGIPMSDIWTQHHLELPKFRAITIDYNNPLHGWLGAICQSHDTVVSLDEVVERNPNLKKFYNNDRGFANFVDRYNLVSSDADAIINYNCELKYQMLDEENRQIMRNEAIAKAKAEAKLENALNAFKRAKSKADLPVITGILKDLGVPDDIIQTARKRFLAEQDDKNLKPKKRS